jgi:hypothetical protein
MLSGCHQHPLAAANAPQQTMQCQVRPVKMQACMLDLGVPASPKSTNELLAANTQKEPECLTGDLADGLLLAFKSFTGRH